MDCSNLVVRLFTWDIAFQGPANTNYFKECVKYIKIPFAL